jgi:hypothetical protein
MHQNQDVWAKSKEEILRALDTDAVRGLSQEEAEKRLTQSGPNRLSREKER